jgi:hypothetical protein
METHENVTNVATTEQNDGMTENTELLQVNICAR